MFPQRLLIQSCGWKSQAFEAGVSLAIASFGRWVEVRVRHVEVWVKLQFTELKTKLSYTSWAFKVESTFTLESNCESLDLMNESILMTQVLTYGVKLWIINFKSETTLSHISWEEFIGMCFTSVKYMLLNLQTFLSLH